MISHSSDLKVVKSVANRTTDTQDKCRLNNNDTAGIYAVTRLKETLSKCD